MKRNTARFLCVVAVCLAATLAPSVAQEQNTNPNRQAHRHLQQQDIAAATPIPELLPDPAAQLPAFIAAAVAAQEFDGAVYPSAAVQQAEETQAYIALVQAAGSNRVRCPTTTTPSKIRIAEQEVDRWKAGQIAAAESAGLSAAAVTAAAFTPVVVLVSWWIYTQEDGKGNVASAQISQQMAVLNAAYNRTGFSFRVRSIRRITTSPEKFKAAYKSQEELDNKRRRLGGATTLNCYTWDTPNGLLGWSTFPFDYNKTENSQTLDGVVLHYGTLPGGTFARFNLGDTLVHESGHWFGLFHTFQGGCANSSTRGGDLVSDTPAQASAAEGCPVGRDTCTGRGFSGRDPITNYMDYTDDSCMNRFSARQITRMQNQWNTFRVPFAAARRGQ